MRKFTIRVITIQPNNKNSPINKMNLSVSTVLNDPFLLRSILIQADYNTILEYCRSYVQAQDVCRDNVFWMQKAQQDFGTSFNNFRMTILSPALRYLQLFTKNGGITAGSELFIDKYEILKRAIQQDRLDLIQYIMDLGFKNWSVPTYEYARKGDQEAVDYYLSLSKDYQIAADGALEGNHKELFDHIWSAVPNYNWNFNFLAQAAARSGNTELFDYILSLAPPNYDWWRMRLALAAVKSGNRQLVDRIRLLFPVDFNLDIESMAKEAINNNNQQMFDHIMSLANYNWNFNRLAEAAARSGNRQMFDHVRSLASNYNWNFNALASAAVESGDRDLFDYIRSLAPHYRYIWNYNSFAEFAVKSGNRAFFDYIRSLARKNYDWNFNELANEARESRNQQLCKYIKSLAPPTYEWNRRNQINYFLNS